MYKFKKIILITMGATALSLNAMAQDWPALSLDAQWEYILNNNSELASAKKKVEDNQDGLKFDILESSTVSVKSSTNFDLDESNDVTGQPEQEVDVQLTANVKLNNALDVSGFINNDEQASVSLNYKPFADAFVSPQMSYAFEKAKLEYTQKIESLNYSLQSYYLNAVIAEQNWSLSKLNQQLKQKQYLATLQAYDLSEATFEEKSDARNAKIQADNAVYQRKNEWLQAQLNYAQLTSMQSIEAIDQSVILNSIKNRQQVLDGVLLENEFNSDNLELLTLEAKMLAAQRKNLKAYEPDMSVTSTYDIDDPSLQLGVSVNFSLAQFKKDDQKEKDTEIAFNQTDIKLELQNLEIKKQMMQQQLEMANNLLASQQSLLEEQTIITTETQFLFEQGERTELEWLKQQYDLQDTKNALYNAIVNLYLLQQEMYTSF